MDEGAVMSFTYTYVQDMILILICLYRFHMMIYYNTIILFLSAYPFTNMD